MWCFVLNQTNNISRRKFIAAKAALLSTVAIGSSGRSHAATMPMLVDLSDLAHLSKRRTVDLLALHTMESLKATFWEAGEYIPDNLSRIAHVLRDHRTQEVHSIDPRLLDFLCALARELELTGSVHVISGYRSPATNEKLRQRSSGVAKRSFHMFGRAIDIRIPEVDSARVRDAAVSLQRGGVGYYPGPDFVHLDTGRVRTW